FVAPSRRETQRHLALNFRQNKTKPFLSSVSFRCYSQRTESNELRRSEVTDGRTVSSRRSVRALTNTSSVLPVVFLSNRASLQSLSQADGELSGLPTPDSTPELPIKNMKALRHHQYEKNQNCNNAKDNPASGPSGAGAGLGFMAVVGNSVTQQAFPFSHHHGNSLTNGTAHGAGASSTSLHLPEERKILSDERAAAAAGGGGGGVPHHHHSQQSLPQTVVDVSALDELLKHIHEVSASGTGGIKVLTPTSSSSLFPGPSSSSSGGHHHGHHHHHHPSNHHGHTRTHHYNHSHHHSNHHNNNSSSSGGGGHHHQQQIPETESAPYYSTSTLPRDGLPKRLDAPTQSSTSSSSSSSSSSNNPTSSTSIPSSSSSSSSTPLQQQVIPERPGGSGVSVARHHSQRHSLIKMGSGGGAVPRHHSFNQRGPQHAHFLARMNTNSSSNGPPTAAADTNGESQRPSIASTCLTRQHSYSEGPHVQRAAIVRRTASLKPQVPPKPLFLPNTATSMVAEAGKYNY
ncbi:uncharacterized protein DDB_G0271670-like, partial [Plectropomus leopardus]|uniref:uncharacterized protein DDB_G0271670-like n=1 Tax=Plectropomus leopardus TaxID=160734 RepID=UPI001C4D1B9B